MEWAERKQAVFRRLLKAGPFTRFYGRVIGPASAQMFGEVLEKELLPHLPPHAKVLEVGCGPGLQAIDLLRRRPDIDITVSDFSAAFVRLAQENARRASARGTPAPTSFVVADAMDLSAFPAASFDGVYSITAIKHFPDPIRGLRELSRVVKPGGRWIVCEIRRESDLVDIEALANLFQVPAALRRLAARLVHANLREECPPLEAVEGWLTEASLRNEATLEALPGRPAWLAKARRAA